MNVLISLCSLLSLAGATTLTPRQDSGTTRGSESLSGIGVGGLASARGLENAEQQTLFAIAGANPSVTSSATFQYGLPTGPENEATWTWRVNITNVDLSPLNDTATQGQSSVNLQFDLQWPGGGSLQEYLADQGTDNPAIREEPLCASRWSYIYPANVTSRYSSSEFGNCTNVLGVECAASLLAALRAGGPCASTSNSSYSEGLTGCEDSFDAMSGGSGASQDLGNSTRTIFNHRNESLVSGDPIYFVTWQPTPSSNLSNFDAAQSRLNMLYLTGGGSGNLEPVLLCQVVTPPATSVAAAFGFSAGGFAALIAALVAGVAVGL